MKPAKWFGIVLAYTVLTLLCVYFIPTDTFFSLLRIVLAYVFVAFVPGYCLINLLFQEGKLDIVEELVLSVALSFSLAGISGLFIGLSSIGITVESITESLSSIVVVLAILAYLRKAGILEQVMTMLRSRIGRQKNKLIISDTLS